MSCPAKPHIYGTLLDDVVVDAMFASVAVSATKLSAGYFSGCSTAGVTGRAGDCVVIEVDGAGNHKLLCNLSSTRRAIKGETKIETEECC